MNEFGFLNRTSILSGNASEPKTLETMIESLSMHQSLFKPTVILDAGIATKDNLVWLRKNGYTYVVSAREEAPSVELEGELVPVGDRHGLVKAALIKSEEGYEEKWLYCESEAKEAVATQMKQSFKKRFENELCKYERTRVVAIVQYAEGRGRRLSFHEVIVGPSPRVSSERTSSRRPFMDHRTSVSSDSALSFSTTEKRIELPMEDDPPGFNGASKGNHASQNVGG